MRRKCIKVMMAGLFVATLFGMTGCGPKNYVIPDYKEYTTGRIFADKYWNQFSGGTNVKLEGTFNGVSTTVLSGVEQLIFSMNVPGGLNPVDVYANREFASQLYGIKEKSNIVAYGETMVINTTSRMDGGNTGGRLAIQLDKLEVK